MKATKNAEKTRTLLKQDGMDDLIADAEVWTETMKLFHGMPRHKQEALYLALKEFMAGNLTVEDDDIAFIEEKQTT